MSTDPQVECFAPSSSPDAKLLILGSMPGVESLRQQQYYAHPQNQFWRIMADIFRFSLHDTPYRERLELLRAHRVALWDTIAACQRPGSMDSDIKNEQLNDFERFFTGHPQIRVVLLNGKTAEKLFRRHRAIIETHRLQLVSLPSTSPAYASMRYGEKLVSWRKAVEDALSLTT